MVGKRVGKPLSNLIMEKKKDPIVTLCLVSLVILLAYMFTLVIITRHDISRIKSTIEPERDTVYVNIASPWAQLLDAIVEIESNGNPSAFNERTNAAGILQITPIFVEEVKRLSGINYTLEDRFDITKSVEMYYIYQAHKNPDKDINKAIYLHNPRGGKQYKNKILEQL